MDFKKGYILKPYEILETGDVLFTNGVENDIIADKETCEAYGYTYNNASGTCSTFRFNTRLQPNFNNISNNLRGGTADRGTFNTLLNGAGNISRGNSLNCLVSGNGNEIYNGINNATLLGVNGKATRQTEVGIGGGPNILSYDDGEETAYKYVDRQMSVVQLSGVTTDNTATKLTVNGDGTNYINIRNNSIVGYEIYLTRLELGGSSGTAGNYSYRNLKGVVQIDDAYSMAFIVGFTRNIGKVGVNGTFSMADSSTSTVKSITVEVTDRNNVQNVWSAIVYIHEIVSTTTTF